MRNDVHAAVPNPADPYDDPEPRLLTEDDLIAALFGEPRRVDPWITRDPFCGLVEHSVDLTPRRIGAEPETGEQP